MGCQNSKDFTEPNTVNNKQQLLLSQESFHPLSTEDKVRINKILDYWFSEDFGDNQRIMSPLLSTDQLKIRSNGSGVFNSLMNGSFKDRHRPTDSSFIIQKITKEERKDTQGSKEGK